MDAGEKTALLRRLRGSLSLLVLWNACDVASGLVRTVGEPIGRVRAWA